jgi:hypothetical protein
MCSIFSKPTSLRRNAFLALLLFLGACNILPLCDAKDRSGIPHPEHWPGTTIEEPAPIVAITEVIEQIGCKLGI